VPGRRRRGLSLALWLLPRQCVKKATCGARQLLPSACELVAVGVVVSEQL